MEYVVLAAALLSLAAILKVQYGHPRTNAQTQPPTDDDDF
jgi:hypothetical protein